MASLTWWTWVWVNSGSWWWTGRPGVLLFMGSQRVGHNWVTELNWTELMGLTVSDTATRLCHWRVTVATDTSKCAMLYSNKTLLIDDEDWISCNLHITKYFSSCDFFPQPFTNKKSLALELYKNGCQSRFGLQIHSMPTPVIMLGGDFLWMVLSRWQRIYRSEGNARVTGKNKYDSMLVSFTLTFVFYCFGYKLIPKRMLPIAWTVQDSPCSRLWPLGWILLHSYGDKKLQDRQRRTFVLLEVYRNIVSWPVWTL